MMKMDGRDSAEYQIWEYKDIMVIFKFDFKSLKDKIVNSSSSPSLSQKKNVGVIFGDTVASIFESFLEREGTSL